MKFFYLIAGVLATSATARPSRIFERQHAPVQCMTCSPFPEQNQCHITTSCIYNWGHDGLNGPNYCACRAGYKANPREVGADPAAQWRLPWATQEGRVFVRPGVACDTLCEQPNCEELWIYPQCM